MVVGLQCTSSLKAVVFDFKPGTDAKHLSLLPSSSALGVKLSVQTSVVYVMIRNPGSPDSVGVEL